MNKSPTKGDSFDERFDARIAELDDWRGKTLSRVRALIVQDDPEVIEDWKWNIPGVETRRDDLHWRDVQEPRGADCG